MHEVHTKPKRLLFFAWPEGGGVGEDGVVKKINLPNLKCIFSLIITATLSIAAEAVITGLLLQEAEVNCET